MHIEILHIDACPNWVEAGRRVETALLTMGRSGDDVSYRLLTTSAEAAEVPFAGSPTILVDGTDAFPSAAPTSDLACRVYRTESGLAGVPSEAQILQALRTVV